MFDVSNRDRYLYGTPCGREVSAMVYGRLQYRPEPGRMHGKRPTVKPWSDAAQPTMPPGRQARTTPTPTPALRTVAQHSLAHRLFAARVAKRQQVDALLAELAEKYRKH